MEKKITTHITKGVVLALILIVIDVISSVAGFKFETWFRWLPTLLFCGYIIWACINYADQMNNEVTFGKVFGHGFRTSSVVASIMVIYVVLSLFIIFPEQKEQVVEATRKQLEDKGNVPQSAIDTALEYTRKLYTPIAIMSAIIGSLLVGAIASLIGAAIAKKNPPSPFQQQA